MRRGKFTAVIGIFCLGIGISACQSSGSDLPSEVNIFDSTGLDSEIDKAEQSTVLSANNSLTQARNAFFNVTGRLVNIDTDIEAYQEMVNLVLPAMLTTANALTTVKSESEQSSTLRSDFEALFKDSLEQMLNGINLSLQVYQNQFEAPQSLEPSLDVDDQSLVVLAKIFEATELAERYISELAQFQALFSDEVPQQTLQAIRSQQTVAINGVLRVANQSQDLEALVQAYQIVVRSLTSPNLLNQLNQLAIKAYGVDKVAFQQNQLTPEQSNPNRVVMVVKESDTSYRQIRYENNVLINEVYQDNRGLSASDLLNQSQVVVVQKPEEEASETDEAELPLAPVESVDDAEK